MSVCACPYVYILSMVLDTIRRLCKIDERMYSVWSEMLVCHDWIQRHFINSSAQVEELNIEES